MDSRTRQSQDETRPITLAHEAPLRIGALGIEPARRRIAHDDGRDEIVEPRVMQVLVALARESGRVVSRDELMMSCWHGVVVGEDSIDRVMGRIRRLARGIGAGEITLETITKVGYRLVSQHRSIAAARDAPGDTGSSRTERAAQSNASLPPLALPAKPSIAVLPFSDPSGAVEGDYFADGMVDEIVNALTRFPSLFVIASGSSLSYREREREFRKIGRELGVRYLLEGSVRRSGRRVRIAVDLVEAEEGVQIWSERFQGTLEDVFALQDEVANAVGARIEPTIQAADLRRGATRPTEDLGAYELFLRGLQRYREFDSAGAQMAIVLFEQAVARDETFAGAWALLATLHMTNLAAGWTADREGTAHKAQDAIRHALLANDDDALALAQVAFAAVALGGDHRSSRAMADRALTLNPGSFPCWMWAGLVSLFCEQFEQALERFQHALRLNPRSPDRYTASAGMGAALVALGRFDEAIPWLNEAITLRPNFPLPLFNLVIALSHLGRIEEAKAVLGRFTALGSIKSFMETLVVTDALSETYLPALKRLGVDVYVG